MQFSFFERATFHQVKTLFFIWLPPRGYRETENIFVQTTAYLSVSMMLFILTFKVKQWKYYKLVFPLVLIFLVLGFDIWQPRL